MQSPEGVVRQNAATKSQAGHMSGTKVALCVRSQALGWGKNKCGFNIFLLQYFRKSLRLNLYLSPAPLAFMTMSIAMKIIPLKGIHLQKSTSKLFLERMFHTKWHELFGFTSQRKKTFCIQLNFNFRKGVHKARLIEPCVQLKEQLDLCSICDFQSLGLIQWSSLATICRASWICWHLQIHQTEPSKKLKPPHVSEELDEFSCIAGNLSHLI